MLSRNDCLKLLDKYGIEGNVLEHSLKVEEVAIFLAKRFKEKNVDVNLELVSRGALLHDIGKVVADHTKMNHIDAGTIILRGEGFYDLAEICRTHAISFFIDKNFLLVSLEQKIVNYADKRVLGDKLVSLNERLVYLKKRYISDEQTFLEIKKNLEFLEKEIFDVLKIDKKLY